MTRLGLLSLALLSPLTLASAQQGSVTGELALRGGQWFQTGPDGRTFAVDPEVISLRWSASIDSVEALVAHLEASANPLALEVARLEMLRTNRLRIADLRLGEGQDPIAMVRALDATGLFDFVEWNTFGEYTATPNDPSFPLQWALKNTGQGGGTPGADMNMEGAWDVETGDSSVMIGVLDSGTDVFHPDLVANRYENPGDPINGLDDDGNGFVDDFYGWDFENNNNDVTSTASHGTQVAGVLGARSDNGLGIASVAGGMGANDGCTFIACGVGSSFPVGSVLDDAIIYAADQGVRVITMSLSVQPSTAIDQAIDYAVNTKGVFVDCAAGNNGGTNNVGYPARLPDVVAIAASTRFDTVASFSSGGPEVWVTAPGDSVLSTTLGNGYTNSTGTSFSAPGIAGLAGLMISANPLLTPADVKDIMKNTAVDIGAAGFDVRAGWGRVDAKAAVEQASGCGGIQSYCAANANSTGAGANLSVTGSTSVAVNDLSFLCDLLPAGQNGLFFYGPGQQQTAFGNGLLCVTGPIQRLAIVNTGLFGFATHDLDITSPPQPSGQILPGSAWSFQFWFRDPAGGGAAFNTSSAITIQFCP